jgi:hypothetical protein
MFRRFVLTLLALCMALHALAHAGLGGLAGEPQSRWHDWLHHEQLAHHHPDASEAPQLQATPEALAHVWADAVWCSPALWPRAPEMPCAPQAEGRPAAPAWAERPHPFLAGLERPPRPAGPQREPVV